MEHGEKEPARLLVKSRKTTANSYVTPPGSGRDYKPAFARASGGAAFAVYFRRRKELTTLRNVPEDEAGQLNRNHREANIAECIAKFGLAFSTI
jgi:hypothetical protein